VASCPDDQGRTPLPAPVASWTSWSRNEIDRVTGAPHEGARNEAPSSAVSWAAAGAGRAA
jgi:hypothetical protein